MILIIFMDIKQFFRTIKGKILVFLFFIISLPIPVYANGCIPPVSQSISRSVSTWSFSFWMFVGGLILFPFLFPFFEKVNNIDRAKIRIHYKIIHVFFFSFLSWLILFITLSLSNTLISLIEADKFKLLSNVEYSL